MTAPVGGQPDSFRLVSDFIGLRSPGGPGQTHIDLIGDGLNRPGSAAGEAMTEGFLTVLDSAQPAWHAVRPTREEDQSVRACSGLAALISQAGPIGGAPRQAVRHEG